jgi:hypothetical protein
MGGGDDAGADGQRDNSPAGFCRHGHSRLLDDAGRFGKRPFGGRRRSCIHRYFSICCVIF